MNKIEIKIPDNLTPEEEVIAIAKKLTQKALTGTAVNKDQPLIGDGLSITHLQTQITITRTSNQKPIEMVSCNVCGCEYQNNAAVKYWHNYGGKPKSVNVCSTNCQQNIIELLGNRAADKKSKLKPVRCW